MAFSENKNSENFMALGPNIPDQMTSVKMAKIHYITGLPVIC